MSDAIAGRPRQRFEGLETIPIRVVVRVGTARCALGLLAWLEPGRVVPLAAPVGAPFELLVHGRVLARVEPVACESGIALKLLADEEEA